MDDMGQWTADEGMSPGPDLPEYVDEVEPGDAALDEDPYEDPDEDEGVE